MGVGVDGRVSERVRIRGVGEVDGWVIIDSIDLGMSLRTQVSWKTGMAAVAQQQTAARREL